METALSPGFSLLAEKIGFPDDLSPLPIALSYIDFVLPITRRMKSNGKELPLRYRYVRRKIPTTSGARYTCSIAGDPILGLPYGWDCNLLIAATRWASLEGPAEDGTLYNPSAGKLLRMLGIRDQGKGGGAGIRAVYDGLLRFSRMLLATELTYVPEQLLLDIETGRKDPVIPGEFSFRRFLEEAEKNKERTLIQDFWIMSVSLDRPAKGTGRHRILRLQVNPQILKHAQIGWTTWIDPEVHATLKSAFAMRIYHLLATRLSEGYVDPLPLSGHDLRELLGCPQPRARGRNWERGASAENAKSDGEFFSAVDHALNELVAARIVDRYGHSNLGTRIYSIEIGPVLRHVRNLRGCGLLDTRENRLLLAAFQHYGLPIEEAREFVARDQRYALRTALYITYRETAMGVKRLDSPCAYIRDGIKKRYAYDDKLFEAWLAGNSVTGEPLAAEREPAVEITGIPQTSDSTDPAQITIAPLVERAGQRQFRPVDVDERTWDLFEGLRSRITLPRLLRWFGASGTTFRLVRPLRIDGSELVLAGNSFAQEHIGKAHAELVEIDRLIEALSDGSVRSHRIEVAAPAGRE